MTTVFVDLVSLDGSRPEGSLRFSLERLVLGDPDIVPSAVEVKIRDGKARVDDLLPGAMRVRVNAGCWSKDWEVSIPAEGEHDLFKLLGEQAKEFEHALWATLLGRVEALENTPAVDLAPVEQRLDALESAPVVDLAPLEKRLDVLESRPEPQPFDPTGLEEADKKLGERLTVLENKPAPHPFDPTELQAENTALKTKVEKLQAQLDKIPPAKPVDLTSRREFDWDLASPLFEIGGRIASTIWMGRVDIAITVPVNEDSQRVLKDGVYFAGVPAPANVPVSRAMTAIGQDGTVKDITRAGLRAEFVSGKIRFYDRGSAPGGVFGAAIARGDEKIKIQFTYYTEEKYH